MARKLAGDGMTNQEIESIRARLNAATPGPWKAIKYYKNQLSNGAGPDWGLEGVRSFEDADLCAHAPTDLRALLAEVERLNHNFVQTERHSQILEISVKNLTAECEEAFKRGAMAMREAAAAEAKRHKTHAIEFGVKLDPLTAGEIADHIYLLAIPKEE